MNTIKCTPREGGAATGQGSVGPVAARELLPPHHCEEQASSCGVDLAHVQVSSGIVTKP